MLGSHFPCTSVCPAHTISECKRVGDNTTLSLRRMPMHHQLHLLCVSVHKLHSTNPCSVNTVTAHTELHREHTQHRCHQYRQREGWGIPELWGPRCAHKQAAALPPITFIPANISPPPMGKLWGEAHPKQSSEHRARPASSLFLLSP